MRVAVNQAVYELRNGVKLIVTPLTAFMQRALIARASEMYPYPDPTPYIKPVENSFEPGAMTLPEQNPEYLALKAEADALRHHAFWNLIIDTCVDYADGPRDEFIESNRAVIAGVRRNFGGTELASTLQNDWVILIMSCLATGDKEVQEIINIAQGVTPLTHAEIVDGFRMFRRVALPKNGLSDSKPVEGPSSTD